MLPPHLHSISRNTPAFSCFLCRVRINVACEQPTRFVALGADTGKRCNWIDAESESAALPGKSVIQSPVAPTIRLCRTWERKGKPLVATSCSINLSTTEHEPATAGECEVGL